LHFGALASTSCAAVEPAPKTISAPADISTSDPKTEEHWPDRAREVLVNALSLTVSVTSMAVTRPKPASIAAVLYAMFINRRLT